MSFAKTKTSSRNSHLIPTTIMAASSNSTADPLPVKDRVAEFETIFWSSPVYLSGVYPINKSGYLLYYGGTQNPRYALLGMECLSS